MRYLTTLLLSFALFTGAFAQTNNQVVFTFTHLVGDDTLSLDKTFFSTATGQLLKITRAQFYISKVEIGQPGGAYLPLTDRYLLVNAEEPDAEYDLGTWPAEAAEGVKLGIGVDPEHNHLDPTTYPVDHPLALKNPSMHWGWAAGYTFMAIEGEFDKNLDGTPETIFQFHNIDDMLYKSLVLSGSATAANGVLHLHFNLDYANLFDNLTLAPSFIFHGSAAPNQQMMNNAANASFVTLNGVLETGHVLQNSLSLSAVPNPANAETLIRYELPATGTLDLVLTNSIGQPVRLLGGLPAAGSCRLTTSDLPAGLYQYAFYENGQLLARKQLVVQH